MRIALATLLAAVVLAVPIASTAAIYKWVDPDGITHFSQTPPQGEDYREIHPKTLTPSPEQTEAARQKIKALEKGEQHQQDVQGQAAAENGQAPVDRAKREQVCKERRAALATLQAHPGPRIKVRQADGSYKRLTEPQREAQITELQREIQDLCQGL